MLFTKNLQPCDAVLLPIAYAANHWPPSHSPQASPSPDPDAHTTCSGSFLCFLKIIMASPHPCQTTRLVIGDRDPGRWVRQAVSEGLTKAHELQLWRCSRGIKLCSSVLRIPSTVLYLLDSCNSFNLNLRPSLGELVLESRLPRGIVKHLNRQIRGFSSRFINPSGATVNLKILARFCTYCIMLGLGAWNMQHQLSSGA